jgi:outer membrane receptor for ferrienterochelin and colicins
MKNLMLIIILIMPSVSLGNDYQEIQRLLKMSLYELMNLEIETASKTAEKIEQIPASVVLITREEIKTYGYSRVEELLEHVSGMYKINTYDGRGSNFGVRGFWNSQQNRNLVILVNGIAQFSDTDDSYAIEPLPPIEAINRVEIIRGPMSVIYGSGAFFGVINIITNEINEEDYHISIGGGSAETRKAFARLQQQYEQGQFILNLSSYQTAGLDHSYGEFTSRPLIPKMEDKTTSGMLENTQKNLNLSATYQDFSLEANYVKSDKGRFVISPALRTGHFGDTKTTNLQLGYKKSLTDNFTLGAKLGYSNIKTETYLDLSVFRITDHGHIEQNSRAYFGELNTNWELNKQFKITSGLQYRRTTELSNSVFVPFLTNGIQLKQLAPGESLDNWGLFLQANYYVNEKWTWIGGIRLQQRSDYNAVHTVENNTTTYTLNGSSLRIIPRLAAIYTANDAHIFKFLYGRAENTPSFSQQMTGDGARTVLNPEEIQTFEINYLSYLSRDNLLSVNIFQNELQNLLIRSGLFDNSNRYYSKMINGGHWQTRGIELSLQTQFSNNFQFAISSTYQNTKDIDNSAIAVAYSPNWLGQMKFAYFPSSNLSLSTTAYYVSSMKSYFDEQENSRIGNSSDNQLILGANIYWQNWIIPGTFANLRIYNLLNEKIHYPTTLENTWAEKGLLGEERTFMFNIGYKY